MTDAALQIVCTTALGIVGLIVGQRIKRGQLENLAKVEEVRKDVNSAAAALVQANKDLLNEKEAALSALRVENQQLAADLATLRGAKKEGP